MTQLESGAPPARKPLVGAGFRPELAELFTGPEGPVVEVAELIADRYFADTGFNRSWELAGLQQAGIRVVIHGLSGNTASVLGPTDDYLTEIRKLADYMDVVAYSDHLALTATEDRALGHLAPNRFDDELLGHVSDNIDRMYAQTGRRPRLENLATKIQLAGSTYTVEEFYLQLLQVNDKWDCLVDVTNLWINSQNRPLDPVAFIDQVPPERLRYIHLAGGHREHGEWIDSHSYPVHDEAFELLEHVLSRTLPDVVIIERDDNWADAVKHVRDDLDRAKDLVHDSKLLVA
jgi:uncharacterized protein (UPF0276 family)